MRKQKLIWLDTAENPEGQMELIIKYRGSTSKENVAAFLEIRDKSSVLVKEKGELRQDTARVKTAVFKCQGVQCWTPDNPAVYQVNIVLELSDKSNEKTYIRHGQKLGFRSLKRQNQQVFWNHKPVKLLGICYREPDSKMENWETVLRCDLELFKAAHINFIRSIYYPFSEKMLELCDEMGFWVENTAPFYELGQTKKNISELPHMQKEFETAAEELLVNGSHTSVLLWSLGHDCAWGVNFGIIRDRIRELDDIRLMTFHLPMSIPEEEPQMDVWPVHDIDWRLPFDKTYDQMVIFHTPGAENEIGYMIADAEYPVPVLHEVWSPVVCHNRDEIQRDPGIRDFWGKSIRTFVEKSARTPGCLGGVVLAGVDEDGSFEGLKEYEWGILDVNHNPKPEYYHLKNAYEAASKETYVEWENENSAVETKINCFRRQNEICNINWKIQWTEDALHIENDNIFYIFSRKKCLLKEAGLIQKQGKKVLIKGGPFLNTAGFLLGKWIGRSLEICSVDEAENVQIKISGTYENTLDICFYLTLFQNGILETAYEVQKLFRHMPHRVKAEIGISSGGLGEKGGAYYVTEPDRVRMVSQGCKVRLEPAPELTEGAIVNNLDPRINYVGNWIKMEDYCGNLNGSETLSNTAGDYAELSFTGTGITVYGSWDILYGMCNVYLDGELWKKDVSQYPPKVDFPGMSRGYEKRYRQILAEVHGLEEKKHTLRIEVTGTKEAKAQNTYTSIDYAVLEGSSYTGGFKMNIAVDFNYPRMVRGCVRRPDVKLIPGVRESFRIQMLLEEDK